MPAPLVIVAVWGVATLVAMGGIALVVLRLARTLANKKLSVLGAQGVGKTTVFQMLRDGKVPEVSHRTVDPEPGTNFVLRISGKEVRFEIPSDVFGNDGAAYPDWQKAFVDSDYVLYLFRADELVARNEGTERLVRDQLLMLKGWLVNMSATPPKIILVGTFADQWPNFPEKRRDLLNLVANHPVIKPAVVRLNNAGLVVGSLATTQLARSVIRGIERELS